MVNRKKPIIYEHRPTFAKLMSDLQNAEEMNHLNDDEYDALIGNVTDKVDALREVVSKIDAETERLKMLRDEFNAAWKASENNGIRLRNYIMFCLKKSDLKAIHGERYNFKIVDVRSIGIEDRQPTEEQYLTLGAKYPGIIRRTLDWDREVLKNIVKAEDPEDLKTCWYNRLTQYVKFGVRRDG